MMKVEKPHFRFLFVFFIVYDKQNAPKSPEYHYRCIGINGFHWFLKLPVIISKRNDTNKNALVKIRTTFRRNKNKKYIKVNILYSLVGYTKKFKEHCIQFSYFKWTKSLFTKQCISFLT